MSEKETVFCVISNDGYYQSAELFKQERVAEFRESWIYATGEYSIERGDGAHKVEINNCESVAEYIKQNKEDLMLNEDMISELTEEYLNDLIEAGVIEVTEDDE